MYRVRKIQETLIRCEGSLCMYVSVERIWEKMSSNTEVNDEKVSYGETVDNENDHHTCAM